MNEKNHLFSNHALKMLLIPLVAEQFLTSLMGTADSMMVSNVGSAAISAVSLVDSINVLVIQAFAALSAGGTIVCSQYIGQKNLKKATESSKAAPSGRCLHFGAGHGVCLAFRTPLLRLVFGKVDAEVMDASKIYFLITSLSFPFIALYDAGASVYRAQGDSATPLRISVVANWPEHHGKCRADLGFPYGSGRRCSGDPGLPCFFRDCRSLASSKSEK